MRRAQEKQRGSPEKGADEGEAVVAEEEEASDDETRPGGGSRI